MKISFLISLRLDLRKVVDAPLKSIYVREKVPRQSA